ncbi:MAG: NAD-dependent epimerase/dehydratase family protein [Sulfobacillus sp.]
MEISEAWQGRRVLVTGATGFIGSWLISRLLELHAEVISLVLDPNSEGGLARGVELQRTNVIMGRLECYDDIERAVVGSEVDTIFHLGAQTLVGVALRAPLPTFQANIAGTWNVLEVARRHPDLVRRVVIASSDKAYGASAMLPYFENMPVHGLSPYDVSKSCADLLAQAFAHSYGTPAVIARCGNVYGGGDLNWSRIVPGTIRAFLTGQQPVIRSDGTFLRDYLYVSDAVDAYLQLGGIAADPSFAGEAFNFSDENPLSVLDIYRAICVALDCGDLAPTILGGGEHEIHDQYLSARKARDQIGWQPQFSLEEGLRHSVAWYRDFFAHASPPAGKV